TKVTYTSPVRSSGSSSKGKWNSQLAQCRRSSPIKGTSSTHLPLCGTRYDSRASKWRRDLLWLVTRFRTCFHRRSGPTVPCRQPSFHRSVEGAALEVEAPIISAILATAAWPALRPLFKGKGAEKDDGDCMNCNHHAYPKTLRLRTYRRAAAEHRRIADNLAHY